MAASDATRIVHVVGPVEREPADTPAGAVTVQRCLRCDELLAVWSLPGLPSRTFPVGVLLAVDAADGPAGGRTIVGRVDARMVACRAVPVEIA